MFLDVGAHAGDTVEAVVDMDFDRVYSFEPMPQQFAELHDRYGERPSVTLLPFGLSNATGPRLVYGTNEQYEASVYHTPGITDDRAVTLCAFVDASERFAEHLSDTDDVVAKINCEGSEVDILDSLVASGEIWKLRAVTICFDIARVPEQAHRETETRNAMAAIGFDRWQILAAARGDTHQDRIKDWLATV